MNKSKPFIALPFSSKKINKNLQFNNDILFNQNIKKEDIDVNIKEQIKSINSMNSNIDDKNIFKIDLKENSSLINNDTQCKYFCYDINSSLLFIKNIFLSNEIDFDKK